MTATNSTWENLLPGQLCPPSAQGKYVHRAGLTTRSSVGAADPSVEVRIRSVSSKSAASDSDGDEVVTHRAGFQENGSAQ
jgi:hypothetical protein